MTRPSRLGVAAAVVALSACGTRAPDLHEGKVDLDRSTTTTDDPCSVLETAERGITEASLTATQADTEAKATTTERLDTLERLLPPTLAGQVGVLRDAFDAAWTGTEVGQDPFDSIDYLNADQAIRRYVDAGCVED